MRSARHQTPPRAVVTPPRLPTKCSAFYAPARDRRKRARTGAGGPCDPCLILRIEA
ncbi:hypothetical protein [Xenorhabdus lircayensis]|uniref:Uncharacterized protein n=1 Tax=Xenorhabdus lircayensis TaxID=2763499 RepID=A0ABS0U9W3_9GAMM|nr:hypothetical protein [Xenorhabdus lircayensis]MBI6550684.1 hypothetical protein [Xenorhabdus lircayensis]